MFCFVCCFLARCVCVYCCIDQQDLLITFYCNNNNNNNYYCFFFYRCRFVINSDTQSFIKRTNENCCVSVWLNVYESSKLFLFYCCSFNLQMATAIIKRFSFVWFYCFSFFFLKKLFFFIEWTDWIFFFEYWN